MSSADVEACCEVGWRASWIERCMRGSGQRWRVKHWWETTGKPLTRLASYLRAKRPSRPPCAGQGEPVLRTAPDAHGQRGHKCRGAPLASDVPGLHLYRTSAAPTPGERQSPQGVQAGGPSTPEPNTRRPTAAYWARAATVPCGVVRVRWLCRSPVDVQGTGLLGAATPPLLRVEAMGTAPVQGVAQARGQSRVGLEYVQIGPRAVAPEPESGFGDCTARTRL